MSAIVLPDAAATERVGHALAKIVRRRDVVTLAGPLGSGKTTIARGLLAGLGLDGEAPSPSFAIVLSYTPPEVRLPLWHVDLYRLATAHELAELGLEEAVDGVLLVEWPGIAGPEAWQDGLALALEAPEGGGRRLTWQAGPAWQGRWPPTSPFPPPISPR